MYVWFTAVRIRGIPTLSVCFSSRDTDIDRSKSIETGLGLSMPVVSEKQTGRCVFETQSACSPFHNIQLLCVFIACIYFTVFGLDSDSDSHDPGHSQEWECADAIHRLHLGVIHTYIETAPSVLIATPH